MKAPGEIVIREANASEAVILRDFQVIMAWESEKLRLDPGTTLRGVERIFSEPSLGQYFFVESAGEIAGCLLLQREWSDWRARMILWIHSLYIRPECRKKGLYRKLYESVQSRVTDDADLGGIRLYVDKANTSAISVYEKLGMTREHYHLYEWMK